MEWGKERRGAGAKGVEEKVVVRGVSISGWPPSMLLGLNNIGQHCIDSFLPV